MKRRAWNVELEQRASDSSHTFHATVVVTRRRRPPVSAERQQWFYSHSNYSQPCRPVATMTGITRQTAQADGKYRWPNCIHQVAAVSYPTQVPMLRTSRLPVKPPPTHPSSVTGATRRASHCAGRLCLRSPLSSPRSRPPEKNVGRLIDPTLSTRRHTGQPRLKESTPRPKWPQER